MKTERKAGRLGSREGRKSERIKTGNTVSNSHTAL